MASEENAAHLLDTLLWRHLRRRRGGRPLAGVDPGHGAQPVGATPVARSPAPAPQPRRISRPSREIRLRPPAKTTSGNSHDGADPAARQPKRPPEITRQRRSRDANSHAEASGSSATLTPILSSPGDLSRASRPEEESSTLTRTGLFKTSSKRLETRFVQAFGLFFIFFFFVCVSVCAFSGCVAFGPFLRDNGGWRLRGGMACLSSRARRGG